MIFRNRLRPDTLIRFGMVFLILASSWRWFARSGTLLSQDLIDAVGGLLYGICIGLLLLGIWRKGRGRSTAGGPSGRAE